MTSVQDRTDNATTPSEVGLDMKLEVIVIPVSDVDRAKEFYSRLGWREDADFATSDSFRVVQFTPPGSGSAIIFGTGITGAVPGSVEGLQLVVSDLDATRAALLERGIEVSEIFHDVGGIFHHAGVEGRVTGPAPDRSSYGSFASFEDPDGNGWIFQEVTTRLPGRLDPTTTTYSSVDDLSAALQRAAAAHGEHEKRTGQADPQWPHWYATYMVREQSGEELPR